MKTAGVTVTWRADKRQWVGKYRASSNQWPQKVIPVDVARGPRDRAKAIAWLTTFATNAQALGLQPKLRPGGLSLRAAFLLWEDIRRNDERTAPSTLRANGDLFRNVVMKEIAVDSIKIALADEDIVTLGTDFALLRRWIRAVSKLHSAGRVRAAVSKLSVFYDDAIVERWFRGANPLRNEALIRELPALPTLRMRQGNVSLPLVLINAATAASCIPLMRRSRYLVLASSGLREGEVSGLRWGALSLDHEPFRIDVVSAKRLLAEEGEELGPLKTPTSSAYLPLHSAARAALLEWRDDEENGVMFYLGRKPMPSDPVFPSSRARDAGGFARPDTADHLRHDLSNAGLSATDEKGRNYTAQALRRSFGTMLEESGVEELTRKRLMRHGSLGVTADYYTGENWVAAVRAIESLGLVWAADVPYEAPARPLSHQDRVSAHLATHPLATAAGIASALGIKTATAAWVVSRLRNGRLVPALVPNMVPTGTNESTIAGKKLSRESGLNRRPALYESATTGALLVSCVDVGLLPPTVLDINPTTAASPTIQSSGQNPTIGTTTQVRLELDNGLSIAAEYTHGEPGRVLVDSLVRRLRLKGIVARRVGSQGLQIGGSQKRAGVR